MRAGGGVGDGGTATRGSKGSSGAAERRNLKSKVEERVIRPRLEGLLFEEGIDDARRGIRRRRCCTGVQAALLLLSMCSGSSVLHAAEQEEEEDIEVDGGEQEDAIVVGVVVECI
jgi:hypothetical protein